MTRIRRILTALATLTGAILAFTAAAPAALAIRVPPPGGTAGPVQAPPQVHTIIVGGMPGWQIALIAAVGRPGHRRHSHTRGPRLGGAQGARHHRLNRRPYLAGPRTGKVHARPGHHYPGPISF